MSNRINTFDPDTLDVHKWIAVGDIYLDFPLLDYDRFNFNDLYILQNSGDDDGVFCVYRPRRDVRGAWSTADLIGYVRNYSKLLTFIDLRAPFINLRTDEKIRVNGKFKQQKVFIFFPSANEIETAVTTLYLKHFDHRYSVSDVVPF